MAWGIHPFPFRTRKLRPTAATILGPQGPGKIARRQIQYKTKASESNLGGLLLFNHHTQRVLADVVHGSMLDTFTYFGVRVA
jgi:hypothetical protein